MSDKIDEINKEDVFLVNLGDESKKYVSTEIDKMPESLPPYQVNSKIWPVQLTERKRYIVNE